tara:strand:+ start:696 stop:917 length:222 start_codon:yes stop_codon:yes gene_type:complete
MNDLKFTTAGDYMKDVDMIEEPPIDEVAVEKAAAERLRKSETARAKRKTVKDTVTTRTENEYAKARRARKNND